MSLQNKKRLVKMFKMCLIFSMLLLCTAIPTYAGSWSFKGEGWYQLYPKCASGKCLDVSGAGKSNGTNIQIYQSNSTNAQWFYFASLGNGYYTITSKSSGKVLDIRANSKKSGANVHQWDYKFLDSQIWKVESAGNGYYYLKPSNNESLALDVSGGVNCNGGNVWVYKFSKNNAAQMWRIWNGNTKSKYTSVTSVKSTSTSKAVTYYVSPSGDSKVTIWAVNSPIYGGNHYYQEKDSRFRVKIISGTGKIIANKIIKGKSNTLSVSKKYGDYRVEISKYGNWADDFMWNHNFGYYCQMSLKNARLR